MNLTDKTKRWLPRVLVIAVVMLPGRSGVYHLVCGAERTSKDPDLSKLSAPSGAKIDFSRDI